MATLCRGFRGFGFRVLGLGFRVYSERLAPARLQFGLVQSGRGAVSGFFEFEFEPQLLPT